MSVLAKILLLRKREEPSFTQASLTARMGLGPVAVAHQAVPISTRMRPVVQHSEDLARIAALPIREHVEVLNFSWLKKPVTSCRCEEMQRPCCKELLPLQAQALSEATRAEGLLLAAGVGHGKELVFQLLPLVVPGVSTAVLFITTDMRDSLEMDREYYGQHWVLPNLVGGHAVPVPGLPRLKVIAYSELSHEKFTAALAAWQPELVMGNEAHNLCRRESVRTRRVLSFGADHPAAHFVWGSGTLTTRSIQECAHLAALALGAGSPYPVDEDVLSEWASAVDPDEYRGDKLPALMGALVKLCRPGEDARAAFKRRRMNTLGVIDTTEGAVQIPLYMHRRDLPEPPENVKDALKVARNGSRPDLEWFKCETDRARCLHQLAAGFYYKWIFPKNEFPRDKDLVDEWFARRQAWNREVRETLEHPVQYMDSPLLVTRAALRHLQGEEGTEQKPVLSTYALRAWLEVHKQVIPETKTEWLSDWVARDALAWAQEAPGIVWYSSKALERKLEALVKEQKLDIPVYGEGEEASGLLLRETGKRSVLVAMKPHHKNKDLTRFTRNLFTQAPPSSAMWEQLLGRTHRRGQRGEAVHAWLYLHTPELKGSFKKACDRALFVEGVTPGKQKLCYAKYSFARAGL